MFKRQPNLKTKLFFVFAILAMGTLTQPGCVGALSQLLYMVKGHTVEPAYSGLNGKRVAIVCVSDASAYGPDTLTYLVGQAVGIKLANGLDEDSSVISSARVEEWIDTNGWNETEFVELGEGVGADMVLAIEIGSYSLHEGSTLFKGRSDTTATVYDVKKQGQVMHVFGPKHFAFPKNGRPAIQTTEREFEAFYLAQLTTMIANEFIVHDRLESVASDAMDLR
jgi:hypothetical protein